MRALWLAVSTLLLAFLPTAAGHEHVEAGDGKYELTVGWRDEPPFAGIPNGLDLKVALKHVEGDEHEIGEAEEAGHDGEAAEGEMAPAEDAHDEGVEEAEHTHEDEHVILGAHEDLTVTYEYATKTFQPLDFRPAFGRPGWYTAEITPTRAGVYKIHIAGTIEGTPVDVTVEPHEVEDLDETSFPETDPTTAKLAKDIAGLDARLSKLEVDTAAQIANPPPVVEQPAKDAPSPTVLGAVAAAFMAALALRRR
ncbi:MAG TPA: hypothetical protein VI997_03890 [Candidatus Thermoplasmatota archaeon]|nr:hypothetical protein [Candidatus Thermoplasmatota archaeon]